MAVRWVACLGFAAAMLAAAVTRAQESGMDEVAGATGLDFVHVNGAAGRFLLPEIMGPGVALFDFDQDGDLDVYLVQGGTPGPVAVDASGVGRLTDRLYRNDLDASIGATSLHFTDVTAAAGVGVSDYGMGIAAADYDGDGWVDLYVTNFGPNRLLRNRGDGTFEEVGRAAGVDDPSWSVSAAFVDYDRDGDLDLFVGNYVEQSLGKDSPCRAPSSARDYCTPSVYRDQPDRLYRNRGDGRFEDVSAAAGIARAYGPALGVMVLDANGDGWPDLYVANDAKPNLLWINSRDGTFREDAMFSGVAVNMAGAAEGSMGVAAGDFDNDGDEDLFMSHLTGETNTLYVNDGKGWFEDRSSASGLAGPSTAFTGFGTAWLDYDNDGWLDVFVANGEVSVTRPRAAGLSGAQLGQHDQLFVNRNGASFSDRSAVAGLTRRSAAGRGLAVGDLDNDGDSDVLVGNNAGPVHLWLNRLGGGNRWVGLDLRNARGAPAVGARVGVIFHDGRHVRRRVGTDGSYASAGDPRLLIGLGTSGELARVRVDWPDGGTDVRLDLPQGRYTVLSPRPRRASGGVR